MTTPRVTLCDAAALVTFRDKEGNQCSVPIVKVDGKWIDLGGYTKYGLSPSDPKFGLTFGLPHKFKIPRQWVALAERQLKRRGTK